MVELLLGILQRLDRVFERAFHHIEAFAPLSLAQRLERAFITDLAQGFDRAEARADGFILQQLDQMIDHLIVLLLFVQLLAERAQTGYRRDAYRRSLAVFAVVDGQTDGAFLRGLREAVKDRGGYDLLPGRAGDRSAEEGERFIAAEVGHGARRRDGHAIAFG